MCREMIKAFDKQRNIGPQGSRQHKCEYVCGRVIPLADSVGVDKHFSLTCTHTHTHTHLPTHALTLSHTLASNQLHTHTHSRGRLYPGSLWWYIPRCVTVWWSYCKHVRGLVSPDNQRQQQCAGGEEERDDHARPGRPRSTKGVGQIDRRGRMREG